ncbi:MAG TPA: hypothetical protein VIX84_00460, partial [Acidimicrobiales bacterium]
REPDADDTPARLDALKCDMFDEPLAEIDGPLVRMDLFDHTGDRLFEAPDFSYAAIELELDLIRRRLAIWEIFGRPMKAGATCGPKCSGP